MSSSLALLWSCKQHVLYATNNHTKCQLSLTSAHITQQMQWKKLTFEIHSSIIWKSLTSSTLKLTLLTQSVTRTKNKTHYIPQYMQQIDNATIHFTPR